jgi:hypothetical protein
VSVRALVVGVGNYTAPGLLLENPPADARAVAATLQRLGASVTLLVDPTRSQLRDALETFSAPQVQQVRRVPPARPAPAATRPMRCRPAPVTVVQPLF